MSEPTKKDTLQSEQPFEAEQSEQPFEADPSSDADDPRSDEQERYWSGAHTRHRLRFHLIWIPKYRRRVLTGPVAVRLEGLVHQACAVNHWQAHELSIQPDHVHLLLQCHPRESVSKVMQCLKGGTSRVLRSEFPELEEFLWGDQFWADGYFAETVGKLEEAVVRAYIREQQGVADARAMGGSSPGSVPPWGAAVRVQSRRAQAADAVAAGTKSA